MRRRARSITGCANADEFKLALKETTELTENQLLQQCQITSPRSPGDEFGCAAIGFQYQQGLKTSPPPAISPKAVNNVDRPPVSAANRARFVRGRAVPHFNEVDDAPGWMDRPIASGASWVLRRKHLHDLRWAGTLQGRLNDYVWVFLFRGRAARPFQSAAGKAEQPERQTADVISRPRGGTLKGIGQTGPRRLEPVFIMSGRCIATLASPESSNCRARKTDGAGAKTTPQWRSCTPCSEGSPATSDGSVTNPITSRGLCANRKQATGAGGSSPRYCRAGTEVHCAGT